MKRKIFIGILMIMTMTIFGAATVFANETRVRLDGNYVNMEPAPIIVDGRTLLPARAIVEMLGGEIFWDNDLRQVHINHGGTHVLLTINDPVAYINSAPHELDVPPQIVNDRTLVPLRFVAESLGVDVDFEFDSRTVIITTTRIVRVTMQNFVLSGGDELTILYTPVVRRNSQAEVFFQGPPNFMWNLTVRYADGYGTEVGLGQRIADGAGFVEWQWRVDADADLGDWPVTISGNNESLRFYLSIVSND